MVSTGKIRSPPRKKPRIPQTDRETRSSTKKKSVAKTIETHRKSSTPITNSHQKSLLDAKNEACLSPVPIR